MELEIALAAWFGIAFFIGLYAHGRGASFISAFILSVIATPLIAIVAVLLTPAKERK